MSSLLGKIVKGVLIGGGSILSLLCPPVGGAIVSAGMAIGAGAVAVGGLINTADNVTANINGALNNAGLLAPAEQVPIANYSTAKTFVLTPGIIIAGAALLAILIFKPFKRR
jgi:hypothetical protein